MKEENDFAAGVLLTIVIVLILSAVISSCDENRTFRKALKNNDVIELDNKYYRCVEKKIEN